MVILQLHSYGLYEAIVVGTGRRRVGHGALALLNRAMTEYLRRMLHWRLVERRRRVGTMARRDWAAGVLLLLHPVKPTALHVSLGKSRFWASH